MRKRVLQAVELPFHFGRPAAPQLPVSQSLHRAPLIATPTRAGAFYRPISFQDGSYAHGASQIQRAESEPRAAHSSARLNAFAPRVQGGGFGVQGMHGQGMHGQGMPGSP